MRTKKISFIATFLCAFVGLYLIAAISHPPLSTLLAMTTVISLIIVGMVYSESRMYPTLLVYMDFMISEIPNVLQIFTFAGFVAVLFKNVPASVMPITALIIVLNNLYLNNKQTGYIRERNINDNDKIKTGRKFLFFNLTLTMILVGIFYYTVSYLLSH